MVSLTNAALGAQHRVGQRALPLVAFVGLRDELVNDGLGFPRVGSCLVLLLGVLGFRRVLGAAVSLLGHVDALVDLLEPVRDRLRRLGLHDLPARARRTHVALSVGKVPSLLAESSHGGSKRVVVVPRGGRLLGLLLRLGEGRLVAPQALVPAQVCEVVCNFETV